MDRPPLASLLLFGLSLPIGVAQAQTADSQRTTIGGYGEVHYTNRSGTGTPGAVNLKRFVL